MTTDRDVGERLAAIETKLDTLLNKKEDHEVRIRRLERWMWVVAGAAGVLGGQLAQLAPWIT